MDIGAIQRGGIDIGAIQRTAAAPPAGGELLSIGSNLTGGHSPVRGGMLTITRDLGMMIAKGLTDERRMPT